MHRMRVCLAITMALATLAFSVDASAAVTYAPPGNAGVDQYFDPLPASGGTVSAGAPGGGQAGSLAPRIQRQLAASGAAGAAVAKLASSLPAGGSHAGSGQATPGGSRHTHAGSGRINPPPIEPQPLVASGRGSLSQLLSAAVTGTGAGGTGVLLPLVLVGTLVIAVAGAVRRRSRRS